MVPSPTFITNHKDKPMIHVQVMSPECDQIFAALAKAQLEMEAAEKDSVNPFHKSKYADIQSVFKAIRKPLANHGICISQPPFESGENAVVITILGHVSGQWILAKTPIKMKILKESKNGTIYEHTLTPQELTAAITYARRTAAASTSGCYAGEKDDDGNSVSEEHDELEVKEKGKDETPIIPEKVRYLNSLVANYPGVKERAFAHFKIEKFDDVKEHEYKAMVANIEAVIKAEVSNNKKKGAVA